MRRYCSCQRRTWNTRVHGTVTPVAQRTAASQLCMALQCCILPYITTAPASQKKHAPSLVITHWCTAAHSHPHPHSTLSPNTSATTLSIHHRLQRASSVEHLLRAISLAIDIVHSWPRREGALLHWLAGPADVTQQAAPSSPLSPTVSKIHRANRPGWTRWLLHSQHLCQRTTT